MTKQELNREVRRQRLYADRVRQKAYDTSYALNLLLNGALTPFHRAMTSDGTKHDFLRGVVRSFPEREVFQCFSKGDSQADDKQIILWVVTFKEGDLFGLALREDELKQLPHRPDKGIPRIKEMLQEAIKSFSAETSISMEP